MDKALVMIVHACLVNDPATCEDHAVRLGIQGGDPSLCVYYSVREIAQWQQINARWEVKSWKCAFTSPDEYI